MRALSWFLLSWLALVDAARLLAVFPTNTRSHYAMYGRLVQALAERHHQITVLTHFPMKNLPHNVEEISLAGTIHELSNNLTRRHNPLKPGFVHNLEQIMKECVQACDTVSRIPSLKALLNSTATFDLVIVEVFGSECFLPLGRRFKAPVVGLLSSVPLPWVNDQLGNPDSPAYIPSYMLGYGQQMNLWERFSNTVSVIVAKIMYKYYSQIPSQAIADRMFGPGPTLESLATNYSVVLSNSHFSINEVRPLVPSLIEVGGLHLDETQTLPKDLKTLLDASLEGIIYWSFGSMSRIETIPTEQLSAIFSVLAELPQSVLVKMDRAFLPANLTVPENVYTMNWIPQYRTLCHPNVKLFIAHGGLLGTQEAVACGVPMLIVPLYADQALNARAMSDRGVAHTLPLNQITEESWRASLTDLLTNPRFKNNAQKLKSLFLDRPVSPLSLGVYWIEYVARHRGAPHLRSPAVDVPLYQYLLLDVAAICIAITLLFLFILHNLFRYLCTRCIKWWPEERLVFEKRLFRRNSLLYCLFWKFKVKPH